MEYGFNLQTLVVCIPVVSLVVRSIKRNHLLTQLERNYSRNSANPVNEEQVTLIVQRREWSKLDKIYKWHALGGLIQTVSLVAAIWFFNLAPFAPMWSIYEMISSANALRYETCSRNGNHYSPSLYTIVRPREVFIINFLGFSACRNDWFF